MCAIIIFISTNHLIITFAIEAIQQTFNGTPTFGNRVTCQISRNGDLIHRVYLSIIDYTSGDTTAETVCPYFGLRLINYVEIEIGGQKIDKHYSHWMYIWNELSLPKSKKEAYKKMVGSNNTIARLQNANLYIPLEFCFILIGIIINESLLIKTIISYSSFR